MKKCVVLLASALCFVSSAWAREKEPIRFLVLGDKLGDKKEKIQISPEVIASSSVLHDLFCECGEEENDVLVLDDVMDHAKKFVETDKRIQAAVRLFVAFVKGEKQLKDITDDALLDLVVIADVLSATKNEREHFEPQLDVLALLFGELTRRVEAGGTKLLNDFLEGKGFIRTMLMTLPASVLMNVPCHGMSDSYLFGESVVLRGHSGAVWSMLRLPGGEFLSGSEDKTVRRWQQGENGQYQTVQTLRGLGDKFSGGIWLLVLLPDGRLVVVFENMPAIDVWKRGQDGSFKKVQTVEHDRNVLYVVPLRDGRLASASSDSAVRIWKLGNKGKFYKAQNPLWHADAVWAVVELPNGMLASCSRDHNVKLWKPDKNGQFSEYQVLRGHTKDVYRVVVLRDGRLASLSDDTTVKIWKQGGDDLFKEEQLLPCGNTDRVDQAIELQDGTLAVSVEPKDRSIRLWKRDGDGRFGDATMLGLRGGGFSSMLELHDGNLASTSDKETIKIWRKDENGDFVLERTLVGHTKDLTALMELGDGRLVSGSEDKTLRVWNNEPLKNLAQAIVLRALTILGYQLFTWIGMRLHADWYKKLFQDEFILNTFASLPDGALYNFIALKGAAVLRIAVEQVLEGIKGDMNGPDYIKLHQKELRGRLSDVERLLRVLKVKSDDPLGKTLADLRRTVA